MIMEAPLKKRKRIILSCIECRRKKVKCDRVRPTCGSCRKSFKICQYEKNLINLDNNGIIDSQESETTKNFDTKNVDLTQKSSPLSSKVTLFKKFQIMTPESSRMAYSDNHKRLIINSDKKVASDLKVKLETDIPKVEEETDKSGLKTIVDFYSDIATIRYRSLKTSMINSGPFSGITLLRKDFFGEILLKKMIKFKMKYIQYVKVAKPEMSSYFANPPGRNELMYSNTNSEFPQDINEDVESWQFLVDYPSSAESDKRLAKVISDLLPPRSIIYAYIDRFFKHIYPFYPLIDELSFRQDISKIIGRFQTQDKDNPWEMSDKVIISFEEKHDFLDVGLLLLVLKFAYLTVFYYQKDNKMDPEVEKLKQFPLANISINLVKFCLNKYRFLKKTGLCLLIALYYFEIYETTGFEKFCEEYSGSSIFVGTLLYSGYSIGLHRDILDSLVREKFEKEDMRIVHLWRKAWYSLYDLTLTQAFKSTSMLGFNDLYFSTKLPDYEYIIDESNCCDLTIEKSVIDFIRCKYELNCILVDLLSKVSNVKKCYTVKDLEESLSKLEKFQSDNFMNFEALINDFRYRKTNKLGKHGYVSSIKIERNFQIHMPLMEIIFLVKHTIFLELEKDGSKFALDYFLQALKYACEVIYISDFWTKYGDEYVTDHAAYRFIFSANYLLILGNFSIFICTFLMRIFSLKYQLLYMQPQIERKLILERCVSLEKIYSEAVNLLTTCGFIMEGYNKDFHTATKAKVGIWFALLLMTDENSKFEGEISEIFTQTMQSKQNHTFIFSDIENISADFDLEIFSTLLNYKDMYDSLKFYVNTKIDIRKNDDNISKENNLDEDKTSYSNSCNDDIIDKHKIQRSQLSLLEILNFDLNQDNYAAVSDIVNGTGQLEPQDIASFWKFLAGDKYTSKAKIANEMVFTLLGMYISEKKAHREQRSKRKDKNNDETRTRNEMSSENISRKRMSVSHIMNFPQNGMTNIERSFSKIMPKCPFSPNSGDKEEVVSNLKGTSQKAKSRSGSVHSTSISLSRKNLHTNDSGLGSVLGNHAFTDNSIYNASQQSNLAFGNYRRPFNDLAERESLQQDSNMESSQQIFRNFDESVIDSELELEYFLRMNENDILGSMNLFTF